MAVLEAMSMGRAVVTTDVAGCRETIIDGESGILVPPGAPAALAVAMEQFIEDPGLVVNMGIAARQRAAAAADGLEARASRVVGADLEARRAQRRLETQVRETELTALLALAAVILVVAGSSLSVLCFGRVA